MWQVGIRPHLKPFNVLNRTQDRADDTCCEIRINVSVPPLVLKHSCGLYTLALQVKLGLGVIITNNQALHVMGPLHQMHLVVRTKSQIQKHPGMYKKYPRVVSDPHNVP